MFNFRNAVSEPTRERALLDPVLFSDECNLTFSEVIQVDRTASDHDATSASFQIPVKLNLTYKRDVWIYKHADFNSFTADIGHIDWENHMLSCNDVDDMTNKFSNTFLEIAKRHIPYKTVLSDQTISLGLILL